MSYVNLISLPQFFDIRNKNKVVVIAVHPDDETLGCGGTLFRHNFDGDKILIG